MTADEQRVWDTVFAIVFANNTGCSWLAISQANLAISHRRKYLSEDTK